MSRYDIVIIGTGPAGLEAAITAKIRNKNILLIGSKNSSTKVEKAHTVENYLGLPHISGIEMQKAFLEHTSSLGIEITEDQVIAVYNMSLYFMIQTKTNYYEASSVILATGVLTSKPYPNEETLLGKGVSYCATCDGALYKNKTVAVIATSKEEEDEVLFLKEYASKVHYFPLYKDYSELKDIDIHEEKPLEIIGTNTVEKLVTDKNEYEIDGLFILRESVAPKQLVPGLETDGPHAKVNLDMSTNIPGVFACGDIAGLPYQYIKSAGQGNVAALSAVKYLSSKTK